MGEVVARARARASSPTTTSARACSATSTSSASTPSATAARRASATRGRCPTRSPRAIAEGDLVACAVLSGNRNFEARIHPEVKANYLASPPLVVAYALAGRMDVDLEREPLGQTPRRRRRLPPRRLAELGRDRGDDRVRRCTARCSRAPTPTSSPATRPGASLPVPDGDLYAWEDGSTYVRRPSYLEGAAARAGRRRRHRGRALPRRPRRLGHDRPHLAGGLDQARLAGRALPRRARRRAARLQLVRRAARQPRGDGARHVRERPPAEPARARLGGHGGRCTCPRARRRRSSTRRERYLAEGTPLDRARRQGVRLGLVARLGGEGAARSSACAP